jgi:capsular polysaccharide biosynthesis protein
VNQVSAGLLDQLQLPLRVGLALGAGAGLALLVDYLDPTVRGRKELEEMGLPVVGEIPKK